MDVKKVVHSLLKKGFKTFASDLYIFPNRSGYELSYRYHHDIESYKNIDFTVGEKLILYLKYLGGMDIAEKRKTQVGSATVKVNKQKMRIRLSSVGDYLDRETLVIRFLQNSQEQSNYHYVLPNQYQELEQHIQKTGLYLFSGPTGAGKSTTMNHLATAINQNKKKQIITIEDPVEIENTNFLQFQVNQKIDLTYNALIKVCLRHRPDVLIIGEVRDRETAQMVVRAALTGHMVFSTIHATDKESVLIRMEEFGIPKIELEQCLKGVVYQELIPVKNNYRYGVMYDYSIREVKTNWQESFETAYKKGFITETTYRQNK